MGIVTTCQYKAKSKDDSELQKALTELTDKHGKPLATGSAAIGYGTKGIIGITSVFIVCIQR